MAGPVLAALIAISAAAIAASAQERPPQKVTVVTLAESDVTLTATLPGRVVASGVAEVRPQVNGIIIERLFEEGAEVALGDEMYRIDPASYDAQKAAAEGAVAQAEARARAARKEEARVEELLERKIVSPQAFDTAVGEMEAAEAALLVARAELLAAEIALSRTTLRAPLSGVVGRSLATQGALVTAGQAEPLAVIRTLDPVLVDVTQSAAEMLAWRRGEAEARLEGGDRTVKLRLADGTVYEHEGTLTAADPYVNELTGVVTLRMRFSNPDRILLPGMYVQVEMPQGVARDVILAPQEGVSRDRRGRPTALIVNADNVVEQRELEVLQTRGTDWIVTSGLKSGDRLIVAGLQKTGPGATVVPEERATSVPAN
jgi:membrane fusion protein (multidrug efflux system)